MSITIISVGKLKEKYLKMGIEEYAKRLSGYTKIDLIEVPDEKIPDNSSDAVETAIKEKEGLAILSHIKPSTYTICLDLKGKQYSSVEFSEKIDNLSMYNSTINFIIGVSLGISPKVLQASNELICFSKMTFPHQLIRIFLLEQIYRAFKISNNETYHK